MARTDHEIRITPSILDRRLDYDPHTSREAPPTQAQSLAVMNPSV